MANRAYLLSVDRPDVTWSEKPEQEVIAEGINEVPVFWASIFDLSDRRVDKYEGDGAIIEITNWCTETTQAISRLNRLSEPIAALLHDQTAQVWRQWVEHISAEASPLIKTNAAEVWDLNPEGYEAYMRTLFAFFSNPTSTTLEAAVKANDLGFDNGRIVSFDPEETACKLAGADHIREVPWLD